MKRLAHLSLGAAVAALAIAHPAKAEPLHVSQTASFASLSVPADGVSAPDGKTVTLTVNGIETQLVPGTYSGDVVLTVADDIPVTFGQLPTHHFRTALFVEDGDPVPSRSVTAAIRSGEVGQDLASNLRITSRGENFNGVVAAGHGSYRLDRPFIDLTGNGGNDFAGYGAAIMSTGEAVLTVERPVIRTKGAVRLALFVDGNSTMHLNGADIEVLGGTLPENYQFTVDVGRMMEVPWMLGLSGNARASNLAGNGTMIITNSHVRARGWGSLSTDVANHTRMIVEDSVVEALEAGYGTYSIGDSHNTFVRSIIRAADIGGILAGEASLTFTDHTAVEAGLYGVMMHSGQGGGTLTIDDGSHLWSGRTAIQIKGRGVDVMIDNADVVAGNGILIQAMANDDPFMMAMMRGETPPGMSAPPPGTEAMLPEAGARFSPDVQAILRNATLSGDIFNGRTQEGKFRLTLGANAGLKGVVSTSTVVHAQGSEPTRETYREIGNVVNTPRAMSVVGGMDVTLEAGSRWTVTGTSYLTALTISEGAVIEGVDGRAVELSVNGRPQRLGTGSWSGAITLSLK